MKAIFFLLLLANIVLFLYEMMTPSPLSGDHEYDPNPHLQLIQRPGDVKREELSANPEVITVKTSPPAEKQPVSHRVDNDNDARLTADKDELTMVNPSTIQAVSTQPEGGGVETQPACFKAEIFDTLALAQKALTQLEEQVTRGQIEVSNRQVPEGFWVVYPAANTFEKSRANLEMLASRGMKDLWLFERGPLRGAISLGWFRVEAYAVKALQRYRQQGLDVEMQTKSVAVNEYSILFESRQSLQLLEQMLDVRKTTGLQVRQLQSCRTLES